MNIKIEIIRNPAIRGYEIWITNELGDGVIQLAKPFKLEFMDYAISSTENNPTIVLPGRDADNFLQAFAEALEKAGYKSGEIQNANREITAIKYHLGDMRALVFKKE